MIERPEGGRGRDQGMSVKLCEFVSDIMRMDSAIQDQLENGGCAEPYARKRGSKQMTIKV